MREKEVPSVPCWDSTPIAPGLHCKPPQCPFHARHSLGQLPGRTANLLTSRASGRFPVRPDFSAADTGGLRCRMGAPRPCALAVACFC